VNRLYRVVDYKASRGRQKSVSLFLYSDGLTDCGNLHAEAFSRDRLVSLVRATREGSLSASVARIASEVRSWRGNESYDDDITLAGVERAGSDS
jgi:serine phosphatase RsbU (regulator of sigma subunit)